MTKMRLVVMETPYAGDTESNIAFGRACLKDCLARDEPPLASHLLYTQPGVLEDAEPAEREKGIGAGHAWIKLTQAVVFYIDRGISGGMRAGLRAAVHAGATIEFRNLEGLRWKFWPEEIKAELRAWRANYPEMTLIIEGKSRPGGGIATAGKQRDPIWS